MAGLAFQTSAPARAPALVDADTAIRSVLFIAVFLAVWISFHPFPDLAEPPSRVAGGGDVANQVAFSTIFIGLAAWTWFHEPLRLKLVLRPALIVMLSWFAVTVVTSWEPALALRRLIFTLVIMSISAMALLLPKNLRHFADLMAIVAFIVLAACYLGVLIAPYYAVHQVTDFLEPEHAGEWRGVFAHKNEAGANMVLLIFVGLFLARSRSLAIGGAIAVSAAIFLACTQSKTAIGVLPVALGLSAVIPRLRRPALASALVVIVLGLFNLFSIGTVIFEPVHNLIHAIMPDSTFTGRADIWELGTRAVALRPITGYGFGSFFGTHQVVYGVSEGPNWPSDATDAHNAYLNLALTVGLPGMALAIIWAVALPVVDYFRRSADVETMALRTLFLRVCLYGTYAACFESSIMQQASSAWFLHLTSIFGLCYLARTRVAV